MFQNVFFLVYRGRDAGFGLFPCYFGMRCMLEEHDISCSVSKVIGESHQLSRITAEVSPPTSMTQWEEQWP